MNQVPYITIEQIVATYPRETIEVCREILSRCNGAINEHNKANVEQSQEQPDSDDWIANTGVQPVANDVLVSVKIRVGNDSRIVKSYYLNWEIESGITHWRLAEQEQYITADEARKLGAGKAEWKCNRDNAPWNICTESNCEYAANYLYRAIKQPEPVEPHAELKALYAQQVKYGTLDNFVWQVADDDEQWHDVENNAPQFEPYANFHCVPKPTCQVRNEDTGELKTMTREAAKLLQAELGGTVEWFFPNGVDFGGFDVEFILGGIYSYKLHPLKQIEWTGSREDVIALLNELGFRC